LRFTILSAIKFNAGNGKITLTGARYGDSRFQLYYRYVMPELLGFLPVMAHRYGVSGVLTA
jgi:hypothetical protein